MPKTQKIAALVWIGAVSFLFLASAATAGATSPPELLSSRAAQNNLFPDKPSATITRIDTENEIITAKNNTTGQTFQFELTNPLLLKELTVGQPLFVNMKNKWISLEGERINGNITSVGSGDSGKNADPANDSSDDSDDVAPATGDAKSKPATAKDGKKADDSPGAKSNSSDANSKDSAAGGQQAEPSQDSGKPGSGDAGEDSSSDSAQPAAQGDEQTPAAANPGAAAVGGPSLDSTKAAGSAGACCVIMAVDRVHGLVTGRERRTGRIFQFRVAEASALQSLKAGQPLSADFQGRQVVVPLNGQTINGNIVNVRQPPPQN